MQLTQALRRLHATGHNGFEGLILRLVERLTGYPLYLARSGDQGGRGMRSGGTRRSIIAVECKRHGESTELEQAELVGKLAEAKTTMPMLDIWVLVASRPIPDQVYTAIERLAAELRIGFAIVSTGDGTPSSLAALCATAPDVVRTFLSRLPDIDLGACDEELRQIQADPGYQDVRARLERELSRSATYEWWRRCGHRSFIDSLASCRASHAAFGQLLDVRAKTASSQLVTRVDAQGRLTSGTRAGLRRTRDLLYSVKRVTERPGRSRHG